MKKELLGYLLGFATPALALASFSFACFAAFVMYMVRTSKRDKDSERTPEQWSWDFFWKDTWRRIVTTFILIILALRLLFNWEMKTSYVIALAIVIGLISDKLGAIFEKASTVSNDVIIHKIEEASDKLDSAKKDLKNIN